MAVQPPSGSAPDARAVAAWTTHDPGIVAVKCPRCQSVHLHRADTVIGQCPDTFGSPTRYRLELAAGEPGDEAVHAAAENVWRSPTEVPFPGFTEPDDWTVPSSVSVSYELPNAVWEMRAQGAAETAWRQHDEAHRTTAHPFCYRCDIRHDAYEAVLNGHELPEWGDREDFARLTALGRVRWHLVQHNGKMPDALAQAPRSYEDEYLDAYELTAWMPFRKLHVELHGKLHWMPVSEAASNKAA